MTIGMKVNETGFIQSLVMNVCAIGLGGLSLVDYYSRGLARLHNTTLGWEKQREKHREGSNVKVDRTCGVLLATGEMARKKGHGR